MSARGLRCVGWYHSHPVFEPTPSVRDIANQANYQWLCRDETSGVQPFIGLICAPFDQKTVGADDVGGLSCFHVRMAGTGAQPIPMACAFRVELDARRPCGGAAQLARLMCALVHAHASHPDQTRLSAGWRRGSKAQKVDRALLARLRACVDEARARVILRAIGASLCAVWTDAGRDNAAQPRCASIS